MTLVNSQIRYDGLGDQQQRYEVRALIGVDWMRVGWQDVADQGLVSDLQKQPQVLEVEVIDRADGNKAVYHWKRVQRSADEVREARARRKKISDRLRKGRHRGRGKEAS